MFIDDQLKKIKDVIPPSEHMVRSMIKYGNDIITLISADGSIKYRSPSYFSLLGYEQDELVDQLVFEMVHPDDIHTLKTIFAQLMESPGINVNSQWRQKHKDGTYRWMEGTGANLLDDPNINAIVCNFRDITEHVETKHQLEKSNQELNRLFNNIDEVMYSAERNPYKLTKMSAATLKVYGYPASDFFESPDLWYDLILPEDKQVIEKMTQQAEKDETVKCEYRIRHKDGSIRWIEANVTLTVDQEGKLIRVDGINHDITAKKNAEEALLNSEKKFRTLIENSKDGIALSSSDRKFQYISPAIKDITGYEPEELIGKNTFDLFHPEEEVENANFLSKLINKADPFGRKVLRALHKDGSWRWVELTASNKLEDPAVNAIVTNFRDVTEKRIAEERLLNSEQKFRALIENNKDGIGLTDRNQRFTYLSPSVKNILGYDPHELVGTGAFERYHPDDLPSMIELAMSIRNERNRSASTQVRIMHKDRSWRWIELTATNKLDDPAINAVVTNFRDVTERKKSDEALSYSEQRFKTLIEKNQNVVVLSAADGLMVYLSPSISELLDYTPEELLGRSALEIMHPDELEDNIQYLTWVNQNPGRSMFMTLRIQHKDGSWRWVEATSTSHLDNPAVNGIVSNLRDVTDKKKAQDELKKLNQSLEKKVEERTIQLAESNKALESFSSLAAHDLQAPLRILSGYTSIIKSEYAKSLGAEGTALLDVIVKQTKHMTQLVSDLLKFSRASHTIIKEESVNLDDMVHELADELCLLYSNGTTPEIKVSELGHISCDAQLMKQVWSNLISNALKYSAKKEKTEIEIGRMKTDSETIYYVKDNGAGFDTLQEHKLFQVFQRLHSMNDFEGTGIGLALVKNVITRHGGRVWAESEVDKGATFYFSMPD